MCSATENLNRSYSPVWTSTIIDKKLHFFSSCSSDKFLSPGPRSLPDLGLFLCQGRAPMSLTQLAYRTEKAFCWPSQYDRQPSALWDVSKPTGFCTTRSPKYFAKAVKYSCLHYRWTRLCPTFSKFTPQT